MNRKFIKGAVFLIAVLFIVTWGALASAGNWQVNVTYNLDGGQWEAGKALSPHSMEAKIGEQMPSSSLDAERSVTPVKEGFFFQGWGVLFTNPKDGTVIFDSGNEIWDLSHPFDYYPDNPQTMDCQMKAIWSTQPKPKGNVWQVHLSHDLTGGQWPADRALSVRTITANLGESMAHADLEPERNLFPSRGSDVFLGWSVRFTDPTDNRVIFDSGNEVWNMNQAFDYYSDNPLTMNCLMTARWKVSKQVSSPQAAEILPDGRKLTRPFDAGTDPLPAEPPPAETIIPGTEWYTSVVICALQEGAKAPVFSFPMLDGPIVDWVGLDDQIDYGLYLSDGWVMLYHPRWVESGGIGFISHEVIDFPGIEEGEP